MDAAAGGVEIALLPWPELPQEDGADEEPAEGELAAASDDDAEEGKAEEEERRVTRLRELIKREAGAWAEAAAEVRMWPNPGCDTARLRQPASDLGAPCGLAPRAPCLSDPRHRADWRRRRSAWPPILSTHPSGYVSWT